MEFFIVLLCVALYFMSFWCVCDEFSKREVEPGIISFIVLFFPIVNTLYCLIFGADWKLEINENLKKMFGKSPEKEKENK